MECRKYTSKIEIKFTEKERLAADVGVGVVFIPGLEFVSSQILLDFGVFTLPLVV